MKQLLEKSLARPGLFADALHERVIRRTMRRIKAQPQPKRRLLAEPGSIELPADVFSDLLDVGKPVDGRFDEVL